MAVSASLGEQREVALPQGTIRYRERGSGEPIVFVHGVLVNGDLWRDVAPRLADRGYRCIVPDWPLGSHELPLKAGADLSPPGLASLIASFIGALELDRPTLVGNDTGGALAQIVAANHGERLGRLVLTPCDAFDNFFPVLFKYLRVVARTPGGLALLPRSARLKAVRRAPFAFGWLMRQDPPPEIIDSWGGPLAASADIRRDTAKVLRGINKRHTLEAAERLRSFDRPTLIAWASEDKVFPLAHAERLAEIIPNARLRTIEGSYSFVPEDQPQELAELIAEFVWETEAAPSAA
jgi:pimeloyl-ACP methyl ester carboxylesterase